MRRLLSVAALAACLPALFAYDTPSPDDWSAWVAQGGRQAHVDALQSYLQREGVGDVVPVDQLLRQGTDWRSLGEPAYALPPEASWPGMARTLATLRDEVIPIVGPVEVVSGFRTATYNQRAGGAGRSRHLHFEAVDVVPRRSWKRNELHQELLQVWNGPGARSDMGLGLYSGVRFHVDTHRHRRW